MKSCRRTEEMLTDFILGELQPSEMDDIREHLASCGKCRDLAESLRSTLTTLENALNSSATTPGKPRLSAERRATAITAGLDSQRDQRNPWLLLRHPGMARIAAALAALITICSLVIPSLLPPRSTTGTVSSASQPGKVASTGNGIRTLPTLSPGIKDKSGSFPQTGTPHLAHETTGIPAPEVYMEEESGLFYDQETRLSRKDSRDTVPERTEDARKDKDSTIKNDLHLRKQKNLAGTMPRGIMSESLDPRMESPIPGDADEEPASFKAIAPQGTPGDDRLAGGRDKSKTRLQAHGKPADQRGEKPDNTITETELYSAFRIPYTTILNGHIPPAEFVKPDLLPAYLDYQLQPGISQSFLIECAPSVFSRDRYILLVSVAMDANHAFNRLEIRFNTEYVRTIRAHGRDREEYAPEPGVIKFNIQGVRKLSFVYELMLDRTGGVAPGTIVEATLAANKEEPPAISASITTDDVDDTPGSAIRIAECAAVFAERLRIMSATGHEMPFDDIIQTLEKSPACFKSNRKFADFMTMLETTQDIVSGKPR